MNATNHYNFTFNSTNIPPPALSDIICYSIYSLLGAFMMGGNGLILWVVAKNRSLRKKEYIIPAGMAIGDFLYGLGNICAGLKRLYLVLTRQDIILVTAWHCLWQAHNISWIFGCQMMTLMMIFVSIDRLIATSRIATYMKLGVKYAIKGILLVVAYCTCSLLTAIISSYYLPLEAKFKGTCITTWALTVWYADYHFFHQFFAGVICICIYIAIMWTMKRDSAKIEHDKIKAEFKKRQLKVTKMLTFVISSGFFIHDLPNFTIFVMGYYQDYLGSSYGVWVPALWIVSSFSSANNIMIYMVKNREIRSAAWNILGVRRMTNLVTPSEWNTTHHGPGTTRFSVVAPAARRMSVVGTDESRRCSMAVDTRNAAGPFEESRRGSQVASHKWNTAAAGAGKNLDGLIDLESLSPQQRGGSKQTTTHT